MSHLKSLFAFVLIASCTAVTAHAQSVSWAGVVVDPQTLPLPGVSVDLRTPDGSFVATASTDRNGRFQFAVPTGSYRLTASLLGFETVARGVLISDPASDVRIELPIGSFRQDVIVTATMPELAMEYVVPASEAEQRANRDVAEHLRTEAGMSAVRRGPVNLEPTIRGLQ